MSTAIELNQLAIQHGQIKKRNNAITALFCGLLPALLLAHYHPPTWERWLIGLIVGVIWGNGFEYSYHRWLLHRPRSSFSTGHREHHAQVGTPEEAEHVNLGRSPIDIVLMFTFNGIPMVLLDSLLHLGLAPITWRTTTSPPAATTSSCRCSIGFSEMPAFPQGRDGIHPVRAIFGLSGADLKADG